MKCVILLAPQGGAHSFSKIICLKLLLSAGYNWASRPEGMLCDEGQKNHKGDGGVQPSNVSWQEGGRHLNKSWGYLGDILAILAGGEATP